MREIIYPQAIIALSFLKRNTFLRGKLMDFKQMATGNIKERILRQESIGILARRNDVGQECPTCFRIRAKPFGVPWRQLFPKWK